MKGWESIEFKELYQSACEYLDNERVHKVQIKKDESYLEQFKKVINEIQPTHYLYDPRTGNQNWFFGIWEAFNISFLLNMRGIIPIVLLADLAIRTWRAQSAVVTAKNGTVVAFVSAKEVSPIFPHRRLVAPSLMPFSELTIASLNILFNNKPKNIERKAIFTGSLYEPRTTILKEIAKKLKHRGYKLEIKGHDMGSKRLPDLEYWSLLSHSLLILTTADQSENSIKDWQWIKHMIYRYLEVMAAGALLVAPEVPGIKRYFVPGKHFVSFESATQASELIEYYLVNEDERIKIAQNGRAQAQALVTARSFWVGINIGLGKDALI